MPRSTYLMKRAMSYSATGKTARKATITAKRPSFKKAVRASMSGMEEKKAYTNFRVATALVQGTPRTEILNAMVQGDDYDSRDGKQITMNGLTLSLAIASNDTVQSCYGKWCVVLDREAKGVTAAWADVYDLSAGTDDIMAGRLAANMDRFKVLKTGYFISQPKGQSQGQDTFVNEYIDLSHLSDKDRRVKYTGTAAGIASVATNSLLLMVSISDQNDYTGSVSEPSFSYGSKLSYTDN